MEIARTRADRRFHKQVQSAPFIFVGEIVEPRGSTIAGIPADETLAVLRVESALRAPAVLGDLKDTKVTIKLLSDGARKKGTRALFYATSWIYGNGLGVIEVAREKPPRDPKEMRDRIARAQMEIEDQKLADRLVKAAVVVTGHVVEVKLSEKQPGGKPSEHDPEWWIARIEIESVEKGKVDGTTIEVFFAGSLDEYWIESPKLKPNLTGVFVVQARSGDDKDRMAPPGLAVVSVLDVQPLQSIERIRALLKLISE